MVLAVLHRRMKWLFESQSGRRSGHQLSASSRSSSASASCRAGQLQRQPLMVAPLQYPLQSGSHLLVTMALPCTWRCCAVPKPAVTKALLLPGSALFAGLALATGCRHRETFPNVPSCTGALMPDCNSMQVLLPCGQKRQTPSPQSMGAQGQRAPRRLSAHQQQTTSLQAMASHLQRQAVVLGRPFHPWARLLHQPDRET